MGISILKVKPHAQGFTVIFGKLGEIIDDVIFTDFTVDYNTVNNPFMSPRAEPRFAIATAPPSSSMTWTRVEFRDAASVNVIYSGSQYTQVSGCRFELSQGGTIYHDHSTLYVAALYATISSNVFTGGLNAPGAVTAVETHGGRQIISNNIIDGYFVGMNVTGVAAKESEGVIVTGNSVLGGYYGIQLWSNKYPPHNAGYGVASTIISGNVIKLAQTSWTRDAGTGGNVSGNPSGIIINPTANLPINDILISDNIVEYDLEKSAATPFNGAAEIGIGYWDSTNSNNAFNVKIAGNMIINAPASAIRWAPSGGDGLEISGNTIVNAGSAANPGLLSSYRSAIMFSPSGKTTHVAILYNNIIDDAEHGRMASAIEIIGGSCIVADGNVVSGSGGVKQSFRAYIQVSPGKCKNFVRGLQLTPSMKAEALPRAAIAPGSEITDGASGIVWLFNGIAWQNSRAKVDAGTQ
jgi:hypothetical protein